MPKQFREDLPKLSVDVDEKPEEEMKIPEMDFNDSPR